MAYTWKLGGFDWRQRHLEMKWQMVVAAAGETLTGFRRSKGAAFARFASLFRLVISGFVPYPEASCALLFSRMPQQVPTNRQYDSYVR